MELILSCSSEDTEFIELVKEEFSRNGSITETKISGITGYEIVMLIIQAGGVFATTIIPFIVANMTSNKNNKVKSKRCLIDNKKQTISLEGYNDETIVQIIDKILSAK